MKGAKSELPSYYYLQPAKNEDGEEEEDLYDSNGTHITSEYLNDVVAKSLSNLYTVLHDSSTSPLYKCKECDKILHNTGHLVGHIVVHTGENPYVCSLCQRSFANSTRLKLHLRVHCIKKPQPGLTVTRITKSPQVATSPPAAMSPQATSSASDSVDAEQHSSSDEDRTFRCIECEHIFPKDELYRHMKQHLLEKNIFVQKTNRCERCNEGFDKTVSLQRHQEECRGDTIQVSSEVELVPIRKQDIIGGKRKIEENPILSGLLMRESTPPPLTVATVDLDSQGEEDEAEDQTENPELTEIEPSLLEANSNSGGGGGGGGVGFIISSVATVDQQFLESLAQMELQAHTPELEEIHFEDLIPDASNNNLAEQKPYSSTVCSLCGKVFDAPFGLRQHMRIMHAETKPFKCPECKKKFAHERSMFIHLRVHISHRPFMCIVCYKTFARSTALNGHMSSHAHDTIKCIECGEVLVNIHNYANHVEVKHPNFPDLLDQIRTDKPEYERSKILRRILTKDMESHSANERPDGHAPKMEPTSVD